MLTPTSSAPASPGPRVTATASSVWPAASAAARISSSSGTMFVRWAREAASGTMPPKGRWSSTWEAIRWLSIQRPSRTIATAVSSHEVSMARIRMVLLRGQFVAIEGFGRQNVEALVGVQEHVAQALEGLAPQGRAELALVDAVGRELEHALAPQVGDVERPGVVAGRQGQGDRPAEPVRRLGRERLRLPALPRELPEHAVALEHVQAVAVDREVHHAVPGQPGAAVQGGEGRAVVAVASGAVLHDRLALGIDEVDIPLVAGHRRDRAPAHV